MRRLPVEFQLPQPERGIVSENLSVSALSEPEFTWAGNLARCLGLVLHTVFQNMSKPMRDWNDSKWMTKCLMAAFLSEGLPYELLDKAVLQAQEAIKNIESDSTAQWILKPHTDHQSEFAISGIIDGIIQNRVIDRTFIDEQNIRWIIDYKIGEHKGTDLEVFFQQEINRYRLQLAIYQSLLQQNGEIRKIKQALYYPLHRRLIEMS